MKRMICVVFACLLLAACTASPKNQPSPGLAEPIDPIDPSTLSDFQIPEINGYADFSDVLSAKLIDGTQNRNLSPISVYLALAMVAEGANGDTQTELLTLLGVKDLSELRGVCGAMLEKLSVDTERSTLVFADSIWMEDRDGQLNFRKPFLSTLADTYRAEANAVKFEDQKTAEQIAEWITEHTNGKIVPSPDAMLFEPDTIAVLINTIYLKDAWQDSFSESATEPDAFHAPDGDMTVNYMQQTFTGSYIVKGDGYLRYSLYLRRVGRMTFVLPDEGVSLESLLGSPEKIHALLNEGGTMRADVHVKLPKFSFYDSMELSKILQSLGLATSFTDFADFSAMCDVPAKISRVLQESYIGVDEDGVEAAAYTMVVMAEGCAMPEELPKIDFHLERPFLFAIEANDGTVLFIGTVTEPTPAGQN